MDSALLPAMKWLAEQHSVTLDEFRKAHGNMKLEGILAQGWARSANRRVALTREGFRELQRTRPVRIEHE